MVYSADGISGVEALAPQKRFTTLLSYKLNQEYSEMCGFVKVRMLLAIVKPKDVVVVDGQ